MAKEKEAFDLAAKKLKQFHISSTVKLNVGGQIFTTSLQTLTKDAGSMLNAMFSGRFDTKPAEDGSYFIDRDGTCFRYILNYLRTGKLLLPDDRFVRKEVLEEARFYMVQGIVDELDPPKHYNDSVILNSKQADWLTAIHDEGKKLGKCSLLYRATRDGWDSYVFHAKCDSFEGPTMVVVKSTEGHIFGGYTEESWSGSGIYKSDYKAFLFSLGNRQGTGSVKMKVISNPQNAIYCDNSCGPTFGGMEHDLFVCNNPQSKEGSRFDIGHTYAESPAFHQSAKYTFSPPSFYFKVAEMEVFGLEKD